MGLLAASRVRTIQGASGMLNLVMMPMWLGSGVFFSYERFPEVLHPLLRLIPLTALNDALRALMLDGETLASQSGPLLVLAVWGAVSFALAVRVFRWE
jgi:ABC-2 type transport system permease protein